MERLQKVIANAGYTSRRKAEELILNGKVKVNGKVVDTLGIKVKDNDEIEVEGNIISKEEKVYYLLNKPREVITSTTDDKGRKTVTDLIETDKRIYPVGRLDYDSTGAIFLTNDGEFANIITHPKNNIVKTYIAKIDRLISKEEINKLLKGIVLDNKKIIPDRIKVKKVNNNKTCIVEIKIHDGVNHEVKRLFSSIGIEVLKLKRESIDIFNIKDIPSGKYRELSTKEVRYIYSLNK